MKRLSENASVEYYIQSDSLKVYFIFGELLENIKENLKLIKTLRVMP